ncbi:hypothetical protein ACI77M_01335 [Pseudomonas fildesensis]
MDCKPGTVRYAIERNEVEPMLGPGEGPSYSGNITVIRDFPV